MSGWTSLKLAQGKKILQVTTMAEFLSFITPVYDPLGFYTTAGKILFSKLWRAVGQ
jgi:hypothetical protein